MDLINKKIVCELDINCRIPMSQLAKKLRISRNVADYRIKNLEKSGIIVNYICSLDLGVLGYTTYKIYFKIHNGKKSEKDFVKNLVEDKRVIHCVKIEGSFDYAVTLAVKTISELDNFLLNLKNKFNDLIDDCYIGIIVYSKLFKLHKLLLNYKKDILMQKSYKYSGEGKQVTLDEKDKKILRELSQSANLSIVEIAKRTRLSIDSVKYRLKVLSKSPVISYRALLNLNKIGFYHYVILLKIKQIAQKEEEKLMTWCLLKKNVLYCTKRIGYFDFELNIAITDINDLNGFISELKKEFNEIIDSYDIIINSQLLKLNYTPF
jgi:Lrp/AsnC family leucine-responsive transcriptional regulator